MVRRYGDPVEVRARAGKGDDGGQPDSFLWRGRLYVVRSVLGHWRERRAWWNEPSARAVHGEESFGGTPAGATQTEPAIAGLSAEQEVWRVEASAGRRAGTGVYDLCHNPMNSWSLLRVAD